MTSVTPSVIARDDIQTLRRTPPNRDLSVRRQATQHQPNRSTDHPGLGANPSHPSGKDHENTMTKRTIPTIPEHEHTADNYATADETVAAASKRLRANPSAQTASDRVTQLANDIADRRVHTLAALRKARELTQVQIAETLGIGQGDVSKLEQRPNLMLQTLARYRYWPCYGSPTPSCRLSNPGPAHDRHAEVM